MSKMLDRIKGHFTGERKAVSQPLKIETFREYNVLECKDRYRLEATLSQDYWVSDKINVTDVYENFIRLLKEELYGDIRNDLIRLERSLIEEDFEECRKICRDMFREIGME